MSILCRNFVEILKFDAHVPSLVFLWNEDNWTYVRRGVGLDVNFVDKILNLFVNLLILDNGSSVNICVR